MIEVSDGMVRFDGGKPATVADLIDCLKMCDPSAIVTYAYDEFGRNALHGFISIDELVALDKEGKVLIDSEYENNGEVVTMLQEDFDKGDALEYRNLGKWVPCIKLFT